MTAYQYVFIYITRRVGQSHAEPLQDKFSQSTVYDTISEADQNGFILNTKCKQEHHIFPSYILENEKKKKKICPYIGNQ
jgi:hypothetical protein